DEWDGSGRAVGAVRRRRVARHCHLATRTRRPARTCRACDCTMATRARGRQRERTRVARGRADAWVHGAPEGALLWRAGLATTREAVLLVSRTRPPCYLARQPSPQASPAPSRDLPRRCCCAG